MNAERLLQQYERIADAPDAIARLRRFILDLAVRGKLVPQDSSDEPASELLKRIAKEKERRVSQGTLREQKPLPPIEDSEVEFELPQGWQWVRMAEIIKLWNGFAFKSGDFQAVGVPVIRIGDLQDGTVTLSGAACVSEAVAKSVGTEVWIPPDALLIAMSGATTGKTAFNRTGTQLLLNQRVGRIEVFSINVNFLRFFFETIVVRNLSISFGTAIPNLSAQQINETVIPLPPLAEQHRIVAKVDELMGLCDRLEAARTGREAVRDRLAAASLARLNAPDPETFESDARFALQTLPALTSRPDQIKRLRQSILNLAVRGKLVPQDASDEPASELLMRITLEKARLVKAGKIARDKPLPPLTEADAIFVLPLGWEWVRLGNLSQMVTSGSRDWAKHYANEGAIFVRMGNLSKDHYRLRLDHIQHVKPPADGEGTRTRLNVGDILISITGEVGMLGLIPDGFGEAYINQHTAMVRPVDEIKGRYLPELFRSPFAQAQFNEPQRGIKNSFRLTDITQFVVPLPPLAEQHRIVAKVDALMAVCDQLEASLTATAATRRRLLDALLAEALAPVDAHELEAAE